MNKNINWRPPEIQSPLPHGDMPGDRIEIGTDHIKKAQTIFPRLLEQLDALQTENPHGRVVVSLCGGSGVGKSETASLLAFYLQDAGIGTYILSGDNFPYRTPQYNDAERQRVFRTNGIKGLLQTEAYSQEVQSVLNALWAREEDAAVGQTMQHPWLEIYQREGKKGLQNYLGSPAELDFEELNQILSQFKNGAGSIWLKRMGRSEEARWYENVDFSDTKVLLIEWTHGNSDYLHGVDFPILLNSTPAETQEHRRKRGRDGKVDSAFTTMVLDLEQKLLAFQAVHAKMIVAKDGTILSFAEYQRQMAQEGAFV